jgi:hypothetical protein
MYIRCLLLGAALCGATSVSATVRISADRGGQIGHYVQTFAALRNTGESVVVDGDCLSACTLVLGMIPHNQICATPRARFGFHAAWMPDLDGNPVTSKLGTQTLWKTYPRLVQTWISRHGGLSRKMIFLHGRALEGIVASCDRPTRHINLRSQRDYFTYPPRYISARAAKDRR